MTTKNSVKLSRALIPLQESTKKCQDLLEQLIDDLTLYEEDGNERLRRRLGHYTTLGQQLEDAEKLFQRARLSDEDQQCLEHARFVYEEIKRLAGSFIDDGKVTPGKVRVPLRKSESKDNKASRSALTKNEEDLFQFRLQRNAEERLLCNFVRDYHRVPRVDDWRGIQDRTYGFKGTLQREGGSEIQGETLGRTFRDLCALLHEYHRLEQCYDTLRYFETVAGLSVQQVYPELKVRIRDLGYFVGMPFQRDGLLLADGEAASELAARLSPEIEELRKHLSIPIREYEFLAERSDLALAVMKEVFGESSDKERREAWRSAAANIELLEEHLRARADYLRWVSRQVTDVKKQALKTICTFLFREAQLEPNTISPAWYNVEGANPFSQWPESRQGVPTKEEMEEGLAIIEEVFLGPQATSFQPAELPQTTSWPTLRAALAEVNGGSYHDRSLATSLERACKQLREAFLYEDRPTLFNIRKAELAGYTHHVLFRGDSSVRVTIHLKETLRSLEPDAIDKKIIERYLSEELKRAKETIFYREDDDAFESSDGEGESSLSLAERRSLASEAADDKPYLSPETRLAIARRCSDATLFFDQCLLEKLEKGTPTEERLTKREELSFIVSRVALGSTIVNSSGVNPFAAWVHYKFAASKAALTVALCLLRRVPPDKDGDFARSMKGLHDQLAQLRTYFAALPDVVAEKLEVKELALRNRQPLSAEDGARRTVLLGEVRTLKEALSYLDDVVAETGKKPAHLRREQHRLQILELMYAIATKDEGETLTLLKSMEAIEKEGRSDGMALSGDVAAACSAMDLLRALVREDPLAFQVLFSMDYFNHSVAGIVADLRIPPTKGNAKGGSAKYPTPRVVLVRDRLCLLRWLVSTAEKTEVPLEVLSKESSFSPKLTKFVQALADDLLGTLEREASATALVPGPWDSLEYRSEVIEILCRWLPSLGKRMIAAESHVVGKVGEVFLNSAGSSRSDVFSIAFFLRPKSFSYFKDQADVSKPFIEGLNWFAALLLDRRIAPPTSLKDCQLGEIEAGFRSLDVNEINELRQEWPLVSAYLEWQSGVLEWNAAATMFDSIGEGSRKMVGAVKAG